jgi:GT2 family glycosyltransferase
VATPVSIVLPAHNQLEYCRQCVYSVQAHTDYPYRLILVDNGSTDGVGALFDSVPGAAVVHTGQNLGFAGGMNRGLELAEGHAVWLNSDTLVPAGWLSRMVQALESAEDWGMIGPRSNCVSGPQQLDGLEFASLEAINAFAETRARGHAGQLTPAQRLVGFCVLVRDTAFQKVGLLDENYAVGNFEDDDYCLRVRQAGYRLAVAEDAFVFHYGSRTFTGLGYTGDRWTDLMRRNQAVFLAKWNERPSERSPEAVRSQLHNTEARAALEAGDLPRALRLYKQAIAAFPWFEQNYNDVGTVLWQLGEREQALKYFERAVRLRPDYREAQDNLRHAAETLNRLAEVRHLLSE